jgi:hypothetical protein
METIRLIENWLHPAVYLALAIFAYSRRGKPGAVLLAAGFGIFLINLLTWDLVTVIFKGSYDSLSYIRFTDIYSHISFVLFLVFAILVFFAMKEIYGLSAVHHLSAIKPERSTFREAMAKMDVQFDPELLYKTVTRGNAGDLENLFHAGLNAGAKLPSGEPMIVVAACMGDARLEITRCLVNHGADVNTAVGGKTLLQWIMQPSYADNEETIAFLKSRGAG